MKINQEMKMKVYNFKAGNVNFCDYRLQMDGKSYNFACLHVVKYDLNFAETVD